MGTHIGTNREVVVFVWLVWLAGRFFDDFFSFLSRGYQLKGNNMPEIGAVATESFF
jgi:hypothetical protein